MIAVLLANVVIAFYGFSKGNVDKLIASIDGDHEFCGVGDKKDYPMLYLTRLDWNTLQDTEWNLQNIFRYGMCVKECPQ